MIFVEICSKISVLYEIDVLSLLTKSNTSNNNKTKATMSIFNVMQYAANCEANWRKFVMGNGYTPMTTFFNDLSVAECFGKKGINDTYKNVIKSWGKNIKYITEFCMCLNHKIWQLYERNEDVAREYDKLWRKCCQHIENNFSGEDLQYYYRVTD